MNHSIDLRQFRYFVVLCEELHFGRAAQRLHISQPPLSRQIRQLETQLGVDLFVRTKTGVRLTPAALLFLPQVKRVLAQAEKAIATVKDLAESNSKNFSVGYTTVFDRGEIPDVFELLKRSFPGLNVNTYGKHSIGLVADINSGLLDAAFITLHTEAAGLVVEKLVDDPLVVALAANHPLARKKALSFSEINNEPLFWFARKLNPGFYDYCTAYFARIHFKPPLLPEPVDHHILLGAIADGQGIALMPKSLQKIKRKGVVFRPLKADDDVISMGIAVAYLEQNSSPILHKFLELLRVRRKAQ